MKPIELTALAAFVILAVASPAFAQNSIDPGTSLKAILTWGLGIAGILIAIICLFKGIHAVADGRHIGPILMGLIAGTAICFGGAIIVQKFGVPGF